MYILVRHDVEKPQDMEQVDYWLDDPTYFDFIEYLEELDYDVDTKDLIANELYENQFYFNEETGECYNLLELTIEL